MAPVSSQRNIALARAGWPLAALGTSSDFRTFLPVTEHSPRAVGKTSTLDSLHFTKRDLLPRAWVSGHTSVSRSRIFFPETAQGTSSSGRTRSPDSSHAVSSLVSPLRPESADAAARSLANVFPEKSDFTVSAGANSLPEKSQRFASLRWAIETPSASTTAWSRRNRFPVMVLRASSSSATSDRVTSHVEAFSGTTNRPDTALFVSDSRLATLPVMLQVSDSVSRIRLPVIEQVRHLSGTA